MSSLKIKRGSYAQLAAAAIADQLKEGELYLITDQGRIAVGTSTSTFEVFAKVEEANAAQVAILTNTQQSTITTYADITQLTLPVEANSLYEISAFLTFQSAATTTGAGFQIETPPSSKNFVEIVVPITSTAAASQLRTIFPNAAVASNAGLVLGTGVTAINSNHTARISGMIKTNNTAGNCKLQFRSEVAASAVTLQTNSIMVLKKIG